MATKLNPDSIGVIAGAFIGLFARLVRDQAPARFFEVLCGFMYAVQKTKKILELTGVLTVIELSEIDGLLTEAARADTGEQVKELQEILQHAKGEKNVAKSEDE